MYTLPHKEKIYLDQPHVKIKWIADGNCLHVEWRSNPTTEVYHEVLSIQRQIIRHYGCTKVVVSNQGIRKNTLSDFAI